MKTRFNVGLALMLGLLSAGAQIVNDGASLTLSNVTNSFPGDVTVGTNGSFTLLVVSDNTLLTNSVNGVIGRNVTAKSNEVRLISASARWRIGGSLFVGSNGALSRLVVSNGAVLENNDGSLARTAASSNNFALVTGGSIWSNRNQLDIGGSGPGNQMVVSNGGWVASGTGVLGRDTSSSSNLVIITGSGSVWTNALDLFVGNLLSGNRLVIEAGGLVSCDNGRVGTGGGANNNEAVVTGSGSLWTNRSAMTIGLSGSGNRLVVSNGASVRSLSGSIGATTFALNNQVVVTGTGSTWSNAGMTIGTGGAGNRVDVSNGGAIFTSKGTVGDFGFNNTVFLTDSGSVWNSRNALNIGDGGGGNLLVASNGATVLSTNATIGASTSAGNDNLALITGASTVWSNQSFFHLGDFGTGNRLVVSNGATLFVASSNVVIGVNPGAVSNSVLFTDAGTRLLAGPTTDFLVGSNSSFNRLVISNGAVANCRQAGLGSFPSGATNEAVVTGPGSTWNMSLPIFVGGNGPGNRLIITNGGVVNSLAGYLSFTNNEAIVTGAGSTWNNQQDVYLGLSGGGNRLVVTNGGLVVASNTVFIGLNPAPANNNRLTVDGGTLRALNLTGIGTLDVQRGTNVLNAGLIEVDQLLLGDTSGRFEFNGGTLSVGSSTVTNGVLFRVGNGVNPATFNLTGNGLHTFGSGLSVSSNATLMGNATISGNLTVSSGGKFIPGASVGKIVLSNSPSLQGTTIMEISKNGATLTNDQIQVIGALTYGGSLTVNDLGPTTPTAGDNFRLFVASSYAGSFSSISLPVLGPELIWTNKLLVDGSIEVISIPPGDHFWTNALGGNYVIAGNWLLNSVPGPRDNAVFTNNAGYQVHAIGASLEAANAFFDAASGIVTQNLANSSWTLTNSYVVGRNPSAIAAVTHTFGFLRVTNSTGDARFVVGGSGRGTYNLNGGDVTADFLIATNNGPAFTNSTINFNFGNLTTLHGSVVTQNTSFIVGNVSNQTATWTMPRGTNVIAIDDSSQTIFGNSPGSRGVVVASGGSTVWSNSGFLVVGGSGSASTMTVGNGAAVLCTFGAIGGSATAASNAVWVTDAGSRWLTSGNVDVGGGGPNNLLVVSNGGVVAASAPGVFGVIGNGPNANNNLSIVTGSGSVWSNSADLYIGNSGSANRLLLSNGGLAINDGALLGTIAAASNNVAWITDAGSLWTNGGILQVGFFGSGNLLVLSNGSRVISQSGTIGSQSSSRGNQAILTDSNSVWANSSALLVGFDGSSGQLVVSNGAATFSSSGTLGSSAGSTNNAATITGAGSLWSNLTSLTVGSSGPANRLVLSNGGWLLDEFGFLGVLASSSNNLAVVTGGGSLWNNTFNLTVGQAGAGNTLVVSNSGTVAVGQQFLVGNSATSTNNRVVLDGGTLQAFDGFGDGLLDVRRGTIVLNAGLIEVDQLLLTNVGGFLQFNGGTLSTRNSRVRNGTQLLIGNGVSPATFILAGNGLHEFTNILFASVSSNATLAGNGTITGPAPLQLAQGSQLTPGVPPSGIGKMVFSNAPALHGTVVMEIGKNGATLTNDQIQVIAPLTYGGSLVVSNLVPGVLAVGDSFRLFAATAYSGSFSNLTLPALGAGLSWQNNLSVDGTLQVIMPNREFGVDVSHFQNESGIAQASWDQMFAEGKRFVFIKATEGLTGPHDPTMATNVTRALAAGLLAGVYHFAHPENRPTTNGAVLEASNMVVYAGSAIGPGRLRPVLDLEGNAATLSTTALTDWVIAFSDEIIARRGAGAAPIVYCSQSFANNELDSRLANYDLWIRTVNSGADVSVDDPPGQGFADATGVFNNWSFWQYTATGSSGGISPLDLDVCHSEYKSLSSYRIPGPPPTPIQITGLTVTGGGAFQFNFTNGPGALFTALTTTNLSLPLSAWMVLGAVPEVSPGQFLFTDPQATNNPQRFYIVRSP